MTSLLSLIVLVLGASALCSMIEATILSMPLFRVRLLCEEKRHGARDLLFIKENIEQSIATIVVLNNLVNIIGSIFIGEAVIGMVGEYWIGYVSMVLAFLIIIFGEIIPKTVGVHFRVTIALSAAKVLRFIVFCMRPLVWFATLLKFERGKRQVHVTEDEIKMLLRLGRDAGVVEMDEETLINRVFKLNDVKARQIMKPIERVYGLDGERTLAESKDLIVGSLYSRMLVYQGGMDRIVGVCQQRVLLREIANDNYGARVRDFMRAPIFVNEEEKADSLLDKFRAYHQHLFVVDNAAGTHVGILSMEDVLEELFGEIYDEKDTSQEVER